MSIDCYVILKIMCDYHIRMSVWKTLHKFCNKEMGMYILIDFKN